MISVQTLAELHYGAEVANWGAARRARLEQLVDTALIIAPDKTMCHGFGALRARLRRSGHPLHQDDHTADLWIATTAMHLGLPLVSHDGIFAQCPGLDFRTELLA